MKKIENIKYTTQNVVVVCTGTRNVLICTVFDTVLNYR